LSPVVTAARPIFLNSGSTRVVHTRLGRAAQRRDRGAPGTGRWLQHPL